MATSPSDKPWVDIASRLIGLVTALVVVCCLALLGNHALSPADFVSAHDTDAKCVAATVQVVEGIKAKLLDEDSGVAAKALFQEKLTRQKDTPGTFYDSLMSSAHNPPAGYESDYAEMVAAVKQLGDAVTTFGSFIDSTTPSDLTTLRKQWTTQWGGLRDQWDTAVTDIWKAANRPPPTVDETAAAECRSPGVR